MSQREEKKKKRICQSRRCCWVTRRQTEGAFAWQPRRVHLLCHSSAAQSAAIRLFLIAVTQAVNCLQGWELVVLPLHICPDSAPLRGLCTALHPGGGRRGKQSGYKKVDWRAKALPGAGSALSHRPIACTSLWPSSSAPLHNLSTTSSLAGALLWHHGSVTGPEPQPRQQMATMSRLGGRGCGTSHSTAAA